MKKITMKSKIKRSISALLTVAMVCANTDMTLLAAEESEYIVERQSAEEAAGAESAVLETAESSKEMAEANDVTPMTESITEIIKETESLSESESSKEASKETDESAYTEKATDFATSVVFESEAAEETTVENETMQEGEEETETAEISMETEPEIMPEIEEMESEIVEETLGVAFSDTDIAHGTYKKNGNNITWVIDAAGKLTVEGTGDFSGYDGSRRAPWSSYSSKIKTVKIKVAGMTDASFMFYDCYNLISVDLSDFDTINVTNMIYMFSNCQNLTDLDVSKFKTDNVTDMSYMFSDCSSLTNLDVSKFNTKNVTSMSNMFYMPYSYDNPGGSLESLDVSGFDTSNVTDMGYMFNGCGSLTNLDVSKFNTSKVRNMKYMFSGCSDLTSLDVSGFNTSKVTDMQYMFSDCIGLRSMDVSTFDTSNVTNMEYMFQKCSRLTSLNLSNFNIINVTNMQGMFQKCSRLTSLNLSSFNTTNITDMQSMFNGCSGLASLDVSGFDTSKVTYMGYMFNDCSGLVSLDVSGFDTSKVTDMGNMFNGCSGLISLDVSGFDTSKVTDMSNMFNGCSGLESLDVNKFNTSKVTTMWYMFSGCSGLISLDVSGFNTSKVMCMWCMFNDCSSLTSLDLSNFDMINIELYMGLTLWGCKSLVKILTPINVPKAEKTLLPGDGWKDSSGNTYKYLPTNMSSSIELTKKGSGGIPSGTEVSYNPVTDDDSYYGAYGFSANRKNLGSMSPSIAPIKDIAYSGSANTPIVKVTAKVDGKTVTLAQGIDYRVAYDDNVNAGTATVRVSGNGRYRGTIARKFIIKPKPINKAKILTGTVIGRIGADADLSKLVSVYDGTKLLEYEKDYTLTIKDPEQGTVTVKGNGNYDENTTATAKLTVYKPAANGTAKTVINPTDVTLEYASTSYTGKALKPTVTVAVNNQPLGSKDYSVQYQNNTNAGTAFVIVTGKGKYTGKAVQTFTITPQTGTMTVELSAKKTYTYNGKPQKPSLTVKVGGKKLSSKDYKVTYVNNVHAGTATAKVEGIGNYKGLSEEKTFAIAPLDIKKASIKYDIKKASLILVYNKKELVWGVDYTIESAVPSGKNTKYRIVGADNSDFKSYVEKTFKTQ